MTDIKANLRELTEPSRLPLDQIDDIARLIYGPAFTISDACDIGQIVHRNDVNVVIALVEEKLPGAHLSLFRGDDWWADIDPNPEGKLAHRPKEGRGDHPTLPAVALLLALLEAMEGE